MSGKVERLVTWKWAEHPVKGVESEMEDDVIAGEELQGTEKQ